MKIFYKYLSQLLKKYDITLIVIFIMHTYYVEAQFFAFPRSGLKTKSGPELILQTLKDEIMIIYDRYINNKFI